MENAGYKIDDSGMGNDLVRSGERTNTNPAGQDKFSSILNSMTPFAMAGSEAARVQGVQGSNVVSAAISASANPYASGGFGGSGFGGASARVVPVPPPPPGGATGMGGLGGGMGGLGGTGAFEGDQMINNFVNNNMQLFMLQTKMQSAAQQVQLFTNISKSEYETNVNTIRNVNK